MPEENSFTRPQLLPAALSVCGGSIVSGSARGRTIGIPTINIDLACAPKELKHGIYACFIRINGKQYAGAMHFGPRPVFKDSLTFEVHVLDTVVDDVPETVDLLIVGRIRDVLDFPGTEALLEAIASDIRLTRAMLETYEEASQKTDS